MFAVSSGNLQRNTIDSTLLLFQTTDLPHATPTKLLTFSSSSNREGISEIRWASDGETIYFLGSRGQEATQLYAYRLRSGKAKQLTHHSTSLESYALSDNGVVAYASEPPTTPLTTTRVRRHGFDITTENLVELVRGEISGVGSELFVAEKDSRRERRLRTADPFDSGINDLYLSPSGRYLVVKTDVRNVPANWAEYDDVNIRTALRVQSGSHSETRILHYELVDTHTGKSAPLLDAPATYRSGDVLWAPDSESLILCGTYLPLSIDNASARQVRKSTQFVVEVTVPSRNILEITKGELRPLHWDPESAVVQFTGSQDQPDNSDTGSQVAYRKTASGWMRLNTGSPASKTIPEIELKQGLNSPPELAVVDPSTKQATPFWNLNPEFAKLAFGRVEAISLKDASGQSIAAALYLPPGYDSRQRYPLVIQTHGFDSASFSISGYYSTAFAAQPLASRGIIVLQMNDIFYDSLETPQEAERAMSAYQSAIDYLDRQGIVDPKKVGIVGFSRTSFYVKYALTHSALHFAAAVICDGFDAGYFQYLLYANSIPFRDSEIDAVIGAPPFGSGMSAWLVRSPGFQLQKVDAPILIQAIGPTSLMGEWEWFSGLTRLNKPVDLIYLPTGAHVLVKPWDRMVSQGGTVDWFCFWLKGEDSDSEKGEHGMRWGELRRQMIRSGSPN